MQGLLFFIEFYPKNTLNYNGIFRPSKRLKREENSTLE